MGVTRVLVATAILAAAVLSLGVPVSRFTYLSRIRHEVSPRKAQLLEQTDNSECKGRWVGFRVDNNTPRKEKDKSTAPNELPTTFVFVKQQMDKRRQRRVVWCRRCKSDTLSSAMSMCPSFFTGCPIDSHSLFFTRLSNHNQQKPLEIPQIFIATNSPILLMDS